MQNLSRDRLACRQKAGGLPILAPAGTLRFWEVIGQASWILFPFMWVVLMKIQNGRFNAPMLSSIIMWLVVLIIMAPPVTTLAIYVGGVWHTIRQSVVRSSALVFWLYWPFWRVVAMAVAVATACTCGDHLWYNHFQLYEEYYRLQAYDNIDPYMVSGTRLHDAGIVVFNTSSGVDRSRAGCVVNGHTYCVAPIVRGGVVRPGVDQSKSGAQDLFMAGIDCCNCPVTDFRCGDWDKSSGKLGGMRLFNKENSRMFRLAAEKWMANYDKVIADGVFFEWANEPIVAWQSLWHRGFHLAVLYCICGIFGSLLVVVILNGLMRLLQQLQIAAPIDEHAPMLPGLSAGHFKKDFIPHEYRSYVGQQDPRKEASPTFLIL